jgi:hypothetical protein
VAADPPEWLVAWRAKQGLLPAPQRRPQRQPRVSPGPRIEKRKGNHYGFVEPSAWMNDHGVRREPVLDMDHNPPRVVRQVGWRTCMGCGRWFFSDDVSRLRLCESALDGGCRSPKPRT